MVPSFSAPAPCRHAGARLRLPGLVALALALAAGSAQAQAPAAKPRPDPLDPQASVPALRYTSSLKPEGRSADDKPLPWREANDTAARIGGWRVYAREAQQPDPKTAPLPVMPAGHPGHPGQQRP